MSNKPVWILQSSLLTRSGYGDWSMAIAKSLLRYSQKVPLDLKIVPTPWGACSKRDLTSEMNDPEIKELLGRILQGPLNKQPEVFLQITIPMEFVTPAKFNIGLTAGIESTICRPEWLERMNSMQLNIVLSQFNKDVFTSANFSKKNPNGTTEELVAKSPIEVLFWGTNTSIYKKTDGKLESLEAVMKDIPESFGFLFVGQWTANNMKADRKAIGNLIKTFLETFANVSNPPCLILKTSGAQISTMDKYECITRINDITNMVKHTLGNVKLPSVYLVHGELSDAEMNALYNHDKVKVHISFTTGEGFGMPLLEATLSGKPLLVSKWSGHLDFLNPRYSNLLEGSLVPMPDEALNDWFVKESRRFEVDYVAAAQKMKYIYNNYDERVLANAESLRIENAEKFSLQAMDKAFHAILDKHIPKFIMEEPLILPKLKRLNLPKLTLPPSITSGTTPVIPVTTNTASDATVANT